MTALSGWLEAHDKLAGWAQFFGAMLALGVTYVTAFAPLWRRKRQLYSSAARLIANGYEALESYHRTSAHFLPFPISLRFAALTMKSVAGEIARFPVFELDDQGSNSLARRMTATGITISGVSLLLENMAAELDSRPATKEDQDSVRELVAMQMAVMEAMLRGEMLKRPEWPATEPRD
jgi:hypothetical protein